LTDFQMRSTKTLSRHAPLPSMLIAISFAINDSGAASETRWPIAS